MKKLLLSVLILLSANVMFAQFEKKIASSNEDIQNEKKKTNPKTWISRGELFLKIYEAPTRSIIGGLPQSQVSLIFKDQKVIGNEMETLNGTDYSVMVYPDKRLFFNQEGTLVFWEVTKPVDKNALQTAFDAYQEAIKLDPNKGVNNRKIEEGVNTLSNSFTVEGINNYQLGKYDASLGNFKNAIACSSSPILNKTDSLVIFYAGLTAGLAKNFDDAEKYFDKALEIGYGMGGETYVMYAMVLGEAKKTEKQLKVLEEGLKKYPGNSQILLSLIDYYRNAGENPNKILPLIDQAKKLDSENPALWYAEGTLYEKIAEVSGDEADFEKAVASYEESMRMDPNYFFGAYGLGAAYVNRGIYYQDKAQVIDPNDVEGYEKAVQLSDKYYKASIKPMLQAHKLNPKEASIIQALKDVYFRYRNSEPGYEAESEKYKNMLEKLSK